MERRFKLLQIEFEELLARLKRTSSTDEKLELVRSMKKILREADSLIARRQAQIVSHRQLHRFF